MNMTNVTARACIEGWAEAEIANDLSPIADIVADDFMMVGPAGFVLDRTRWLDRFNQGLHNNAFALTHLTLREYDTFAVGIGVQRQETDYQGGSNNGNFRITLILTKSDGTWKLLGYHLSPMMGPA